MSEFKYGESFEFGVKAIQSAKECSSPEWIQAYASTAIACLLANIAFDLAMIQDNIQTEVNNRRA